MIAVKDLKKWLATLSPEDSVGIDDGGLTLRSLNEPDVYYEVGGMVNEDTE